MHGISSYPTITFFGEGKDNNANPIVYNSGRDERAFVGFLNEKHDTHRAVGGGLGDLAGRGPSLDGLAQKFIDTTTNSRTVFICEATILSDDFKRYICVTEKIGEVERRYH